jgi:hypothetical protein
VGVEIGADIGSGAKRSHIGGIPKNESWFVKADYLQKTAIIQQMFRGISSALWVDPSYRTPPAHWTQDNYIVSGNKWHSFLRAVRYLGGNVNTDIPNLVNADGTPGNGISPFMTKFNGGNVYDIDLNFAPFPIPNNNATFANFIGENTINSICANADGNLSVGFRDMRDFICLNFTNLAYVFGHIVEHTFHATFAAFTAPTGNDFLDTNIDGNDVDIPYYLGFSISEIFETTRPFAELDSLSELGVANDPVRQAALMEEIRRIYNNLNSYYIYNHGVTEYDIRKQLKTKTSYGICPHFSFKIGYFIKELEC